MHAIGRVVDTISQKMGDWTSMFYLVVFAVTIIDVFMRYFLNAPTVWGLELVIALAGIHYMLAGAAAVKNDSHVRIDFIYRLLPPKVQRIMTVIAYGLTLVFLAVIVIYGWNQAAVSVAAGETTGAGWNSHAPMWMKIAIPAGAALMILQVLVELARVLMGAPVPAAAQPDVTVDEKGLHDVR